MNIPFHQGTLPGIPKFHGPVPILTSKQMLLAGITPDLLSIEKVPPHNAEGVVLIHQKMFESRLFFVDKLIDMGAQIILNDPHRATVIGLNRKTPLTSYHYELRRTYEPVFHC